MSSILSIVILLDKWSSISTMVNQFNVFQCCVYASMCCAIFIRRMMLWSSLLSFLMNHSLKMSVVILGLVTTWLVLVAWYSTGDLWISLKRGHFDFSITKVFLYFQLYVNTAQNSYVSFRCFETLSIFILKYVYVKVRHKSKSPVSATLCTLLGGYTRQNCTPFISHCS